MSGPDDNEWDDLDADPEARVRAEHQAVEADVLPPPSRPLAVARLLVERNYGHPDGLLLRFWRGAFWQWKRSHWIEAEDAQVRSSAYGFTEDATYWNDKGQVQSWSPNRYRIADVLDALRAVTHLGADLDQPAWLDPGVDHRGDPGVDHLLGGDVPPGEIVACSNALLHVATRELIGHTPRYFNRVAVPFSYDPTHPPPVPQRWLEFLGELWPDDPDSVEALQQWFGYAVSGRTDLHKILLLIGPTRAGKGVIARVLSALLGRGNVAGPTLASLGQNFGLQDLIGKPLAVIADARLGGANTSQVVERLLSISGEDMLTLDRKYREPWTGKLPTRFVVISNELPRFGDASGAIARRFVILATSRSWLGQENPRLTDELLTELPGILGWALDGADRLRVAGHFTEPASSVDAITTLMDTVSPTSAFVRDRCTTAAGSECSVDSLYEAWKAWAEDNGMDRAGTKQTFGRNLRAVVPSLKLSRPRDGGDRERHYIGIALAPIGSHARQDDEAPDATGTHNDPDCGPLRTGAVVHDGPQSNPLSAGVTNGATAGACATCGARTRVLDDSGQHRCSACRLAAEVSA